MVLLIGPTAVGKTALACRVLDRLAGRVQLISADSAMVYRGLDIGTAKPTRQELQRYPHALIDIRDPADPYTAADFVVDADRCVREAHAVGNVPVIVGGTMLYVKRFLEGIAELPPADPDLRAALQMRLVREGGEVLHAELARHDTQAAAGIHPNNPQRLLRALEVVLLSGQPISAQWHDQKSAVERLGAEIHLVGVAPVSRGELHERISTRFAQMLEAGFLEEVRGLFARPELHASLPAMRAVGYRQAWQHLAGELSHAEFVAAALTATRRLAKKQLTWMRQWPELQVHSSTEMDQIVEEIVLNRR